MVRSLLAISLPLLACACGTDGGRAVDAKGQTVSARSLKVAQAEMRRDTAPRSQMQKQADHIVLNADLRRQLGRDATLTHAQQSVLANANRPDPSDPDARQKQMMSRLTQAGRIVAARRAEPRKDAVAVREKP